MKKTRWLMLLLGMAACLALTAGLSGCSGDDDDDSSSGSATRPITSVGNPNDWKTLVLSDSLTNGGTKATMIGGGEFTAEGYHFTSHEGYIIYDTTVVGNFRVEFDTKGFDPNEPYHDPDDQSTILFMQDAPLGTNWTQWQTIPHCLFQMIKMTWYPGGEQSANGLKVKGGCDGGATGFEVSSYYHRDNGVFLASHPLEWNPETTYHWVVTVKNGHTEIFRDGVQMMSGEGFWPGDPMRFFFGGTGMFFGQLSPDNVTFSNINIYQE